MDKAVSYYRTSSLKNVGQDKDSKKRQQASCNLYAKQNKLSVMNSFYDAGISGSVSAMERPEFRRMIVWCKENNVKIILVENVDRFARDVVLQETTFHSLSRMGFSIFCSSGDVKFDNDLHSTLMRQIIGAWGEYERKSIALRLQVARERKAKENGLKGHITLTGEGKCSGRKSYEETNGEMVRETKRLARTNPITKKKRSIRKIARILHTMGYSTSYNTPLSPSTVQRILA